MVKFLLILLLSIACTFAVPAPKRMVKLPLTRSRNPVALSKAHSKDLARWAFLNSDSISSIPAINADVSYLITVGLGTPAQDVDLIFDTGSSNLWVQSVNYKPDSSWTSIDLSETFTIEYGSGSANGTEYLDQITIGGNTFWQEFGIASSTSGFDGVQGLVGFGPDDLSAVTSTGENIPTPVDNMYLTEQIPSDIIGVFFQPLTGSSSQQTNGEVTFGGVDWSKLTGSLTYVPVTTTSPSSTYWGIDVSAIKYGATKVSAATSGIVDTGTTLILLSSSTASTLFRNIHGSMFDTTSGLYTIPSSEVSKLKNISFTIGGKAFILTPSQYLIPADQTANFGFPPGIIYSWISSMGTNTPGMEFILGQKFLENYYSVFDTTHNRVGLAPIFHKPGKHSCN